MQFLMRGLLLAAVAGSSTACFNRYLLDVNDGPGEGADRTTLMQTFDHNNLFFWQTVKWTYWECAEQGPDKLQCEKRCDVKDDQGDEVKCPKAGGFGF